MLIKPYEKANIEFSIIEEIGQAGENSKVYKVHDKQLDAEIVIKEILKTRLCHSDEYFKEAQILYKSAHPNVVQILYACENEANIYIGMPFYKNGSLKMLMDKRHLTPREIIRYSLQVLSGLHNIHMKGLIHFDIKPDNILLSERQEALVSDFGLCNPTNYNGIAEQDKNYLRHRPPEAFSQTKFDLTYDVYQFGLTVYRMCNGDACFINQFNKYINDDKTFKRQELNRDVSAGLFPDRSFFAIHIPAKIQNIVKKCLLVNPNDRYKSCIEVANELSAIEDVGLDWQHKQDTDKEMWYTEDDGRVVKLEKTTSGFTATKVSHGGREQRIIPYCKNDLGKRELDTFFKGE